MPRAERPTGLPDIMRGVAGGVILGLPLVYTQEVWVHGVTTRPAIILALLVVTFPLNVALARYVGFEAGRIHRPVEDAVVGFGLSLILAFGVLMLLERISFEMSTENIVGIVSLTAIPTSLGFALGNALAPREGGEGSGQMKGEAGDLLASAAGALVLSLNIAPTEEPILLAYQLGFGRLAAIVVVSLVVSYLMVFYAEFGGVKRRIESEGATQGPIVETLLAYVVAFGVAAMLLGVFGEMDGSGGSNLAEIVVLSFPASMGSALGRLLV